MANTTGIGRGRRIDAEDRRRVELYEALSDPHRRFTLQYLRDAGAPLAVADLATELAAWEADRPVEERTGEDREALEIALVHCHLPKLAAAGLLEYDHAGGTIAPASELDAVQPVLGSVASD